MKCKFCSKETSNEYEVCEECEKTLTVAINKNRRKMAKSKIANQNRGITSLVCGIIAMAQPLGLLVSFICGIVAIIFAKASRNTAGAQLGNVGKKIGIVSLVACIITLLYKLVLIIIGVSVTSLLIIVVVTLHQLGYLF